MKKKIKLTILSLGLFLLGLNFFFWFTDFIAGKKGIESLSIIYSSVGNEEWLGFWGNVVSGILPLMIIFHYQEESKKQQEQQYQRFLSEKLNKEEQIAKEVLKTWDNSVFDSLSALIEHYYIQLLDENDERIRNGYSVSKKLDNTYKNIQNEFQANYNKEKNKLISIFNYGMLEIDLLPWRLNNTKENLENPHTQINIYHTLKKDCYESFEILYNKFSKDFLSFFDEQYSISPTLDNSKVEKNLNEFNKKKEQLLTEYIDLYVDIINNVSSYFYSCSQYIQNKNFEIFEDKTFFKKGEIK